MTRACAISRRAASREIAAIVGAETSSSAKWPWIVGGLAVVWLAMESEAALSLVAIGAMGYLGYQFIRFALSEASTTTDSI